MIVSGTHETGCSGLMRSAERWGSIHDAIAGTASAALEDTSHAMSLRKTTSF